ncbi:MAG: hypothetical protein IPH05_12550 [Flavobacteriales bacterium]|nr:hypothetical protein [Flavobacteriales bacterium]
MRKTASRMPHAPAMRKGPVLAATKACAPPITYRSIPSSGKGVDPDSIADGRSKESIGAVVVGFGLCTRYHAR